MTLHHDFLIHHGFATEVAHSKDTPARQLLRGRTSDLKLQTRKRGLYWLPIRGRHPGVLQPKNELCTNYSLARTNGSVPIINLAITYQAPQVINWHLYLSVHSQ